MATKHKPGDRCQAHINGNWVNATILTTYPGHGGALVIPDDQEQHAWVKHVDLRPTTHPTYRQGDPVQVRTRANGEWVNGVYVTPELSDPQRHYATVGDYTVRFHETNIRPAQNKPPTTAPPRMTETVAKYGHVTQADTLNEPNRATPHFTVHRDGTFEQHIEISGATCREYGPPPINLATHGRDINGTFTKPTPTDIAKDETFILGIPRPRRRNRAKYLDLALGNVVPNVEEQLKFVDVMAEFAKCGITPEQLTEYVEAVAYAIVTGTTPHQIHQFARQTLTGRQNRTANEHGGPKP